MRKRHASQYANFGSLLFTTTAADNKKYQVAYYNLDMIISVGYRVKSHRGVQFRIWATQVLREYLVKGFAMNDDLLKRAGGGNYFDELLSRIRDIRSSEKFFIGEYYAIPENTFHNSGINICKWYTFSPY